MPLWILLLLLQNRERGEGEELLNTFTGLCLSRKSKKPEGGWVNPGAGFRINAYSGKFKECNGPDSDPASQDIDVMVSLKSGEGKKRGRLYVGDGSIRKKNIPKLAHLRATTSSSAHFLLIMKNHWSCPTAFGSIMF